MVSGVGMETAPSESSKRSELLCVSTNLKRRSWTPTEDAILMEYVNKHGEGNWKDVHRKSGLMRSEKSCRLRWVNHFRPNRKKCSFSPDEERIVIGLHSKLGNKWSRMASHLPGRTDNDIKNYWNKRMRRLQKDVFPIYPQDFQEKSSAPPIVATLHHHQLAKRPQNNNNSSVLVQSQKHSHQNSQSKGDQDFFRKGKGVVDVYAVDEGDESMMKNIGHVHVDKEWDDLSSPSSIGRKLSIEEAIEDNMDSMDDELTSLLDNFLMSPPHPEWYPQQSSNGGGSSSNITSGSDATTTISEH